MDDYRKKDRDSVLPKLVNSIATALVCFMLVLCAIKGIPLKVSSSICLSLWLLLQGAVVWLVPMGEAE